MESFNFFDAYFNYTEDTEPPKIFHRWAAITGIGAYLGRGFHINHGHFVIMPNIYCMLIGDSGSRKSVSIKMMKKILILAGYDTIAADKTTKEKFLLDLAGDTGEDAVKGKELDLAHINIFGDDFDPTDKEMLIAADEFNDFLGLGNIEFISMLGTLWDYEGTYKNRIKNGKSICINNPTISILGGNTPTNFALAFPVSMLGQGFFSRLLLIYGEKTGHKITWPKAPSEADKKCIVEFLQAIKKESTGEAKLTAGAKKLLHKIYQTHIPMEDVRFESYDNRRFSHLLKLCLIVTAARLSSVVEEKDVVYANTILTHTEYLMPKALGEFGKSKHSDTVHRIIQILEAATSILTMVDIWKSVVQDLEKISDLADILRNLVMADKVQAVKGGFLIKRRIVVEVSDDVLDYNLLLPEEIGK